MANHGKTIYVQTTEGRHIHEKVGEVLTSMGGCLSIYNITGNLIRTYSPFGYQWYDEATQKVGVNDYADL